MSEVQQEKRIDNMSDIIDMAGDLMSSVYNDGQMTAAEKIKSFSQGSRVVLGVRAEMRKTAADLAKMGFKVNGAANALTFQPGTETD